MDGCGFLASHAPLAYAEAAAQWTAAVASLQAMPFIGTACLFHGAIAL